MATLDELKIMLVNADKAGDSFNAAKIAAAIKQEQARMSDPLSVDALENIQGVGRGDAPPQVPQTQAPSPSRIQQPLQGTAEALGTLATGATTGAAGFVGGAIEGLVAEIVKGELGTQSAADRVAKNALERSEQLTYTPKSESGKEIVGQVGEVLAPLAALPPVMGASASTIASATPARAALPRRAQEVDPRPKTQAPRPETTPQDDRALRAEAAATELPVPIQYTQGQRSGDFEQQRFEKETAKLDDIGAPLRERFDKNNAQLAQNLDAFIDQTGAKATKKSDIGSIVGSALSERAKKDSDRINTLYKQAEKAGELEAPITVTNLARYLEESAPDAEVANVLKAVRGKAINLGIVGEQDGRLFARPATLANIENLRKGINQSTNNDPVNIRQAAILKEILDRGTEGLGGDLYKKARAARRKYSEDYKNVGLVKNILGKKTGTDDRSIALEDVVNKSVFSPSYSAESLKHLRKLLQTSGDSGKEAWKELQGEVLREIKNSALRSVQRDSQGNEVFNPAGLDKIIKKLDSSGKSQILFGDKGASKLRLLNEVAKDVLTAPPNAVNASNTASALASIGDLVMSAASGIPAPFATGVKSLSRSIRNKKLKAKVKQALGEK